MNRRPSFDHLFAIVTLAFSLLSTGALLFDVWSAPAVVVATLRA